MTQTNLAGRLILFSSLRYTTEAFIDYRIPGCSPKKNYALIGPGVSQNPDQPVSLREKHGFQVGGVAMPPGTSNPPHMHFTAEVFICMCGEWDLQWGFDPDAHRARIRPGDIATVPTWIYRGFQNTGEVEGFMFTALGQDDTGGILWAPQTLEAARRQGVHLTEDYRIVDEQLGQRWDDATMRRLQPMTPQEIEQLRRWTPDQLGRRVVRHADLQWSPRALLDSALSGCGGELAPVIGLGMSEDRDHLAQVMNAHGFSIEWLRLPPGGRVSRHRLASKQVLICYQGEIRLDIGDRGDHFTLRGTDAAWDSYAAPADTWRSLHNTGQGPVKMLLMTSGDARKRIEWTPDVVAAAGVHGFAIDANGYVAPKRFTDRSQR
jgi:quercetin dioxygenase-like cupin family protein